MNAKIIVEKRWWFPIAFEFAAIAGALGILSPERSAKWLVKAMRIYVRVDGAPVHDPRP